MNKIPRCFLVIPFLIAGCATTPPTVPSTSGGEGTAVNAQTAREPIKDMDFSFFLLPSLTEVDEITQVSEKTMDEREKVYSLFVVDTDIREVLLLLSRDSGMNIIMDPDVVGNVTVDFKDFMLEDALETILSSNGYFYERKGGILRVSRLKTELFTLNYLTTVRGGKSETTATISSGIGGEGGTEPNAGEIKVTSSDTTDFWPALENELADLKSMEGKVTVNRLSGTIMVTDTRDGLERIRRFLERLEDTIHREILIEASIVEIGLNDEYRLGVDWTAFPGLFNMSSTGTLSGGGLLAQSLADFSVENEMPTIQYGVTDQTDYALLINALGAQGNVSVVSRPRIVAMNNQPALIKVGTEQPFFSTTVERDSDGSETTTTEVNTVTIGTILDITPQISEDGSIILKITPAITELVGQTESRFGDTAPIVNIRQTSTIVRLKDNQMLVISGLIQDSVEERIRKVPLLGDMPFLGFLFRDTSQKETKTELTIFITPKIITVRNF